MSALLASALAAASLASVPPSFGSEPYVIEFDSVPVHAQAQTRAESTPAPRLVASLGSEPFLPGSGEAQSAPAATAPERLRDPTPPLAASLGSEPFLPGVPEAVSPRAAQAERTPQRTDARICSCS